jgi:hypothetical protein
VSLQGHGICATPTSSTHIVTNLLATSWSAEKSRSFSLRKVL